MAALTVSAPCKLSSASSSLAGMKLASKPSAGAQQHRVAGMMPAVKASSSSSSKASIQVEEAEKEAMQRRSVMFAAAAAAVSVVSEGMNMNAMAAAEPRNGTPEAKKLYARICATMPTAKVCHY